MSAAGKYGNEKTGKIAERDDFGDGVTGICTSLTKTVAQHKEPSLRNAGAALASIGGMMMLGPPPGC